MPTPGPCSALRACARPAPPCTLSEVAAPSGSWFETSPSQPLSRAPCPSRAIARQIGTCTRTMSAASLPRGRGRREAGY